MAYILNIESSTNICSIAISRGESLIVVEQVIGDHASNITLLIDKCLKKSSITMNELSAVAISNGPGSYTSLRIGASVAKGICYAMDIPLIVVDTLETLALAAYIELKDKEALYCPMIDARRMEVYTAIFQPNTEGVALMKPMQALIVEAETYNHYFDYKNKIVLCGNGAEKCRNVLKDKNFVFFDNICSATYMIPLSIKKYENKQFADIAYYTPQYLKAPNITKPKNVL